MLVETEETRIHGIPISRGISIGTLYFFTPVENVIQEQSIPHHEIEAEICRYRQAIKQSKQDIKALQKLMKSKKSFEAHAILEAHLQILGDPLLTTHVESAIQEHQRNADYVLYTYLKKYQEEFEAMQDSHFKEREKELQDIARRILTYLCEGKRTSLANVPPNSIVFTHELASSDVAEATQDRINGFITEMGGATSHAAIIAKAKGIPYVVNVKISALEHLEGQLAIIDGRTGDIILNPTPATLKKYQHLQKQLRSHFNHLEKASSLKAETFDGYSIRLSANIEMVNELDMLHQYGGSGVGLFRSEYIFLSQQTFPSEEEQFLIYRGLVEKMEGLPIIIRTFDIGGDKIAIPQQHNPPESNPYLGMRAIRFLLKERDIFKTQLRAILRASAYGEVSIMFPMVSGLLELIEAKKLVKEAQDELASEDATINLHIRIGCMIEVPSAAIIADLLAKECDFLSIGTNDLVQYSLAAERGNQALSGLYTPTHPSVIRLMKLVVSQANQYGIPVSVCGEVAADPRFTALLLGLGIHELSVASRHIPIVKNAIRNTSIVEASQLAEKILSLTTPHEIQEVLTLEYQKNVPEDFFYSF